MTTTTEELTLSAAKSDLKTWTADIEAGRRDDDPVAKAELELRVSELEAEAADATVADLEYRLTTGTGRTPSAANLATAKGVAEFSRKAIKGRQAALQRAVDAAKVDKLQQLAAEAIEYASGPMAAAIADELVAAVTHLNEYVRLVSEHNSYVSGIAREARTLGATNAVGPAAPAAGSGGITVENRDDAIRAGRYQLRRMDEVSLLQRAKGSEGPDEVAQRITESVNAETPDPKRVFFRSTETGDSFGYDKGSEPGPVQIVLRSLQELDYDTVWPGGGDGDGVPDVLDQRAAGGRS